MASSDPTRVMVDIETLGKSPGCVILSIGAVKFTPGSPAIESEYYVEIDRETCENAGLVAEESTLNWWLTNFTPDERPFDGDASLDEALAGLTSFSAGADEVWANSPSFDCVILDAAYEASGLVGQEAPWDFWQERDVRTITALPGAREIPDGGPDHHALYDAKHQAREVALTLEVLEDHVGE